MDAQGLAVVLDMLLTTSFMSLIILTVWRKHWMLSLAFLLAFGAIEGTFLSASVLKVGTLPLHPVSDVMRKADQEASLYGNLYMTKLTFEVTNFPLLAAGAEGWLVQSVDDGRLWLDDDHLVLRQRRQS